MTTKAVTLAHLVAELRGIQTKLGFHIDHYDGSDSAQEADERRTRQLAAHEDRAYAAIGRYEVRNLLEFHDKLAILFEAIAYYLQQIALRGNRTTAAAATSSASTRRSSRKSAIE